MVLELEVVGEQRVLEQLKKLTVRALGIRMTKESSSNTLEPFFDGNAGVEGSYVEGSEEGGLSEASGMKERDEVMGVSEIAVLALNKWLEEVVNEPGDIGIDAVNIRDNWPSRRHAGGRPCGLVNLGKNPKESRLRRRGWI